MKKSYIILALASLALAASCAKEIAPATEGNNVPKVQMSFEAVAEIMDKAVLGEDLSVSFKPGDAISVFDGTSNNKFVTEAGGAGALFTGAAAEAAEYYALYPYDESAQFFATESSKLTDPAQPGIQYVIPEVQKAVKGSFDPAACPSVAYFTGKQFTLSNMVALMKVTVQGTDVKSIVLQYNNAEPISGTMQFGCKEAITTSTVSQKDWVMLKNADDSALEPGSYYIGVRPYTVKTGLSMIATSVDDKKIVKSATTELGIGRGKVYDLGTVDAKAEDWVPSKTVNVWFRKDGFLFDNTDSNSSLWPFIETKPNTSTGCPGAVYHTSEGLEFDFHVSQGYVNSKSGYYINTIDANDPDYIEFPAIPGKRLIEFSYSTGSTKGKPIIADANGVQVSGGQLRKNLTGLTLYTMYLPRTEVNTKYRLIPGATMQIMQMNLVYAGEDVAYVNSVTTLDASDLASATGTTATVSAAFTALGYKDLESEYECGFEYKTTEGGSWIDVPMEKASLSFKTKLTGLTKGVSYNYRAYAALKGGEKVYGETKEFTTSAGMEIKMVFYENGVMKQPFREPIPAGTLKTMNQAPKNHVFPFVNAPGDTTDINIEMYSVFFIDMNSKAGLRVNVRYDKSTDKYAVQYCTNAGLAAYDVNFAYSNALRKENFGYIKAPAIAGMKLKSVAISCSTTYSVKFCKEIGKSNEDVDAADNKLATITPTADGAAASYALTDAAVNTPYYLVMTNGGGNYQFNYIAFSYE